MTQARGWHAGLVLTWDPARVEAAVAWTRRLLVPGAPIQLLAVVEPDWFTWNPWEAALQRLERAEHALAPIADALRAAGHPTTVEALVPPDLDDLPERLAGQAGALLVLATPTVDARSLAVAQPCLATGCAAAWPGARAPAAVRHVLAPYPFDPRHVAPALAGLRDRVQPERVTLLRLGGGPSLPAPGEAAQVLGMDAVFDSAALDAGPTALRAALAAFATAHDIDLLVASAGGETLLSADATARLASLALRDLPVPVLLVPGPSWTRLDATLDVCDLLWLGSPTSLRIEQVDALGQPHPVARAAVAVLAGGRPLTHLEVTDGFGVLDLPDPPALLGLAPAGASEPEVARLETVFRCLRTGSRRVALLDARADATFVAPLRERGDTHLWCAVRLEGGTSFAALRRRLEPRGVDAILDASALLDEGPVSDVPGWSSGARMLRLARRLRLRGVSVDLVVSTGPHGRGFLVLSPDEIARLEPAELAGHIATAWRPLPGPETLSDLLTEQTGAHPATARRIEVLFDATAARHAVLRRIAEARDRVHLQVYIFRNDPVGQEVAAALEQAADRGVTVRVLVDSLYSLAGSLGLHNRLLQRLEQRPGIAVQRIDPVRSLGVTPFKQRNHRKLLVVDGRIAHVAGRNVGWSYYTGYREVALDPATSEDDVPWVDASAETEGAVVRRIDSAFRAVWTQTGGAPFELRDPGEPGDVPCRLVLHDGLADTNTLDTYRTLFDTAHDHIWVLNSFPLAFELQHALLAALRRGVEVRFVLGNLRPRYGPEGKPFRGQPMTPLITELIHGRVDTLVAAGAKAWEVAVRNPDWGPDMNPVLPHVHAKVVSVDGRVFTAGSANLDITAGYWESEAILACEDPERVAAFESGLEALVREAVPIDPDDPRWALEAPRRAWLSRHWPALIQ